MSAPQKTIDVEPTPEGPKVKAKRQMTEAQLAALKKGREKLAEKRKLQEQANQDSGSVPVANDEAAPTTTQAEEQEYEDDTGYAPLCAIM